MPRQAPQYSLNSLMKFAVEVEGLTPEDARMLARHVWHVLAAEIPSRTPLKNRMLTLETIRTLLNEQRITKKLLPGYQESVENWMKTLK